MRPWRRSPVGDADLASAACPPARRRRPRDRSAGPAGGVAARRRHGARRAAPRHRRRAARPTSTASTGWSCSAARSRRWTTPEVSPELVGVRELLGQALAADFPTLAICLGAQLLAQVGGGTVRAGIDGPEVGATLVAKRDAADADPVFGPLPLSPDVLQWHHDEISELPAGAHAAGQQPALRRTRPSGSAGTSTGCSSTSRRRRRSSASWAERDAVGVAASPHDRETDLRRAPRPRTPTSRGLGAVRRPVRRPRARRRPPAA